VSTLSGIKKEVTQLCFSSPYLGAIADYNQAISIDPRKAKAYFNKAIVYENIRQTTNALVAYQQFLLVAPPQDVQQIAYAKQRIAALER
jgi:tetratricopeptide (TPR) repeat protein